MAWQLAQAFGLRQRIVTPERLLAAAEPAEAVPA
jgi:hypothetical protein